MMETGFVGKGVMERDGDGRKEGRREGEKERSRGLYMALRVVHCTNIYVDILNFVSLIR